MHRHPVSTTFHGRDIFAPVAAYLARGTPLDELGPSVNDLITLPAPKPQQLSNGRLRAEVVDVDGFGNLITNLNAVKWRLMEHDRIRVVVGGLSIAVRHTYADVAPGEVLALVGSDGYVEVAMREGNAAMLLGLGVGSAVEVQGLKSA
jgi:S-adenosylmethionine hydrolase